MHFVTLHTVLCFFAAIATAQDLTQLPTCAQAPSLSAVGKTGCQLTDYNCICHNSAFIQALTPVVQKACSASDLQKVQEFTNNLCGKYSVTISANPTASGGVVILTGGPASGSASATASGSASDSSNAAIATAGPSNGIASGASSASSMVSSATGTVGADTASTASAARPSGSGGAAPVVGVAKEFVLGAVGVVGGALLL